MIEVFPTHGESERDGWTKRVRAIGETVAEPIIQFFDYLRKVPRGEMRG